MCPDWMTVWYNKLCAIMKTKLIEIKTNKKITVPDFMYILYYLIQQSYLQHEKRREMEREERGAICLEESSGSL